MPPPSARVRPMGEHKAQLSRAVKGGFVGVMQGITAKRTQLLDISLDAVYKVSKLFMNNIVHNT